MNKFFILWRTRKPAVFFSILVERLFMKTIRSWKEISSLFEDKEGLEIGGPSGMFQSDGLMPFYKIAKHIDGCNFSHQTVWEGKLEEGDTYQYAPGKKGYQYICDAVFLKPVQSNKYDFVLSCNSLEHIANPLRALEEWVRVLKMDGYIVLVLPKKESNFDHKRSITCFEHLLSDYSNNIGEDDLTHLPEILQLHDIKLDYQAQGIENFKIRSKDNYNNRCLHHHVFDNFLLEQMLQYFGLRTIYWGSTVTDYIIIGKKQALLS